MLAAGLVLAASAMAAGDGLLQRLEAVRRQAEKAATDSRQWRDNYAIILLATKKARLLANLGALAEQEGILPEIDQIGRLIELQARAALERIRAGKPPLPPPGHLAELAYIAANDGSVQPYYVYLPPDWSPKRRWPLIVFLHGYVPSINVLEPWVLDDETLAIAGRLGCIVLIPYGRRNTDFQGVGEVDVLETIRLVRERFGVDESRIYVCGVSMGGMGAWNMALRHPGMFAAAAPICGHTDMLKWWGWPADKVPPFKRWLIEWDNPIDLIENARGQHFFVQHGGQDQLIPTEQSRAIVARAKQLGLHVEYLEYPGADHYIYWNQDVYERAWKWLVKYRLDPHPRRVHLKTYSLEYGRAFWVSVERISRWGEPAEVKARLEKGRVEISARNVDRICLDMWPGGVSEGTPVVVNGRKLAARVSGGRLVVDLAPVPAGRGFPPPKRRGLCGPVEEVFDGPFILVQGTAGGAEADQFIADMVGTWAEEWDKFCDGQPRIATDSGLTEDDIKRYNLVLFGTPRTNSVLAKIAESLPVRIIDAPDADGRLGAVEISVPRGAGDRRVVRIGGPRLGIVMCYPNPLNPDRYVAIYSGELYGRRLPINHKHDLLPDFLVFRAGEYDYDDCEKWLAAGFFDSDWRVCARTLWLRAPSGDGWRTAEQ